MLNLAVNKINIFLSIILGILFGLILCVFLPIVTTNIFFILAVPLICIFFLLMVINVKAMLVVLLFIRASFDPLLNVTKLNIFGENIGAGGAINLLIIMLAIWLIVRNPKCLSQNKLYKSWVLFLFICGLAIIYTPFLGRAIKLFLNLVSYMSMAIIPFFVVESVNDKKFWLKILIFSSLLPVAFANFDLLRGGTYFRYEGMRVQGSFMHPNILAFYLILIIALVFYFLKSNQFILTKTRRNLLWVYMFNLLILLLATKTRSAWISSWALFFTYGLLKEKKYLFFSILISALLLLNPSIINRIRDLFIDTSFEVHKQLNSFTWRLELWKSSLPWIKKKFLWGYGLASFRSLSFNFFHITEGDVASHNSYLELLFETGLVGLISYMAIYLTILKTFFSKIRKTTANLSVEYALVFSYIISYMIVCFADNLLYYLAFNWYFWFFLGVMLKSMNFHE